MLRVLTPLAFCHLALIPWTRITRWAAVAALTPALGLMALLFMNALYSIAA